MTLKVVTANRLREGDVVYLTSTGDWSPLLEEARAVDSDAALAELMATAAAAEKARQVVAVYAMEVARVEGRLQPLGQRERIRANGPTVASEFRAAARAPGRDAPGRQ